MNEGDAAARPQGDAAARPQRLTRAEAKARTREQLLDAAARVFARKGYAGASVEEIAESAGYSIGALYSNFAGKEQLFLELMAARADRRATALAGLLGADDADPIETLGRILERNADSDGDLMALRAEFWLYAVRHPETMGALAAQRREQVGALIGVISAAMERRGGAPPGVSAADVATVVLAMFQGLVRQRRIDPDRVSGDLLVQGLRWLFAGLRTAGPGRMNLARAGRLSPAGAGENEPGQGREAEPGLGGEGEPGRGREAEPGG